MPLEQLATALVTLQADPHAPQLPAEVLTLVSHPLAGLPSQSPKPGLQAASTHPPLEHAPTPLAKVHVVPQAPQCSASVFRFVSQPSDASLLQLPNPVLQAIEHLPVAQLGVPCVVLHAWPQAPQLVGLVSVLTSQPVAYCASQSANGAEQASTAHVVAMHVAAPFCTRQTLPHAPQLATLLVVAVSQPSLALALQLPKPEAHAIPHAPPEQNAEPWLPSHVTPQPPQLVTAVVVSVSQPFALLPSQSANGLVHEAMLQVPVWQVETALGRTQS